ncbi:MULTISPECIES: response regulator [unclassified Actinotalea]|uniref:response regulator n=1 Tax=unclassified Actinotalea TaxID=2638618 RepID=UPI0015F4AAD2|nr:MULTISPECIES: response regulator [unclassified Actinotalea]
MAARVLLVDDVPELRRLVALELRLRGGFEVVGEAGDGAQAVDLARAEQPDLIVLDLGLPHLEGAEVLTLLREVAPRAKVAVFTGLTASEGEALRGRVEGYVPKDADVAALVDLLADLGRTEQRAAVLALAPGAGTLARARDFVRFHAGRWGWQGDLYEAELVVRELVDNALRHSTTPPTLRLSLTADGLRVEVDDDADGAPEPRWAGDWSGLSYVSLIAQGWGVRPGEGGRKVVWARLTPGVAA